MPDYCSNSLAITGPAVDIDKMLELVKSDKSSFSLDAIIPIPVDLKISSGGTGEMAYEAFYGDTEQALNYLPTFNQQVHHIV